MTVTVDDVLHALEQSLRAYLPRVLARLATEKGFTLPAPVSWEQVSGPDAAALLAPQQTPRISLSSPGLASEPVLVERDVWDMEWECVIAFWLRNDGGPSYDEVAKRVRTYTSALLEAALRDRSLGGVAVAVTPVAMDYGGDDDPKTQRTLGAGFVQVNVTVSRALDLTRPLEDDQGVVLGLPPQPDGWDTTITATPREVGP